MRTDSAMKNRAEALEADPSTRHRHRLDRSSAARAKQLELEQRQESSKDDLLPRVKATAPRRSANSGDESGPWLIEEQEAQDWIDAEQEVQRFLSIDSDGLGKMS